MANPARRRWPCWGDEKAAVDPLALAAVNKPGHTQFRVYFATDANDANGNDDITWYPGDDATAANRPVLEIVYQ